MGGLFIWAVAGALAATPGIFSFEGIPGTATTTSSRAFVATGADPAIDQFEPAQGEASLQVRNRLDAPAATYGDQAGLTAELRVGLDTWRLSLVSVGAPPDAGGPLPFPSTLGGVRMNDVVLGRTGIGPVAAPARAAFALFGRAKVEKNGVVMADAAPIVALALATGVHADDDTHRRLGAARAGDNELILYVPALNEGRAGLPYLYAVFEDLHLTVAGRDVPGQAEVAVTGVGGAGGAGGPPVITALQDVPQLAAGNLQFGGPQTADGVPTPAGPIPSTPRPLNADDATPLPESVVLQPTPTPDTGAPVAATVPPGPIPATVQPLNNTSPTPPVTSGPSITPLNAGPATPLPSTPAPLNAVPAAPPSP